MFVLLRKSVQKSSIFLKNEGKSLNHSARSVCCKQSPKMFDKILIANRGEIAIRIMKTCKKMGIKTVGVYSEADENSLFVKCADEAVCIGPAPSLKSYLSIDAIVDACKKTNANAVHPGYGFLSEKATFPETLEKNNITFIGPSSSAMNLMGDKLNSKAVAEEAKVSIVPYFHDLILNADHAVEISRKIGYPVMIKAAGGGGGKGMRFAYNDKEARDGYRLSLQEAKASFNDDRLFVEKFIEEPRHIEFQILGDKYGNVVHLNERECSIQRQNQKILEEAPSSCLTPELRAIMGKQAVDMAKATKYYSAGTIEFLVDKHKNFFFMEMNTRLQVEHPITEMITGIDLVEQMIKVAAGEKLTFTQKDVPLNGWSIEVRVNAENPYKNFGTPSIGRIYRYLEPHHVKNMRIDSGIVEGSEISIYYDSLIAKLISHGKNRAEAIETIRKGLDQYVIRGVKHNMSLIRDIMDDEQFCAGNLTTSYLKFHYPNGFKGKQLSAVEQIHVCACAFTRYIELTRSQLGTGKALDYETLEHFYVAEFDNKTYEIELLSLSEKHIQLKVNNEVYEIAIGEKTHESIINNIRVNNKDVTFQNIRRNGNTLTIQYLSTEFVTDIFTKNEHKLVKSLPEKMKKDEHTLIKSTIQGMLVSLNFKEGDHIEKGAEVAIVEAMKSQNVILANCSGKVKRVSAKVGSRISEGELLIELEK